MASNDNDSRDESDRLLAALEDPRPLRESLPAHGLGHILEARLARAEARHLRLVEMAQEIAEGLEKVQRRVSPEEAPAGKPHLTILRGDADDAA